MAIIYKLLKLAVICAVFFTVFDWIAYGEVLWIDRFLSRL